MKLDHSRNRSTPTGGWSLPLRLESSLRYAALALPVLVALAGSLLAASHGAEVGGRAPSLSEGWKLVLNPLQLSPAWRAAASAVWLAILTFPAGLVAPFAPARLAGWFAAAAASWFAAAAASGLAAAVLTGSGLAPWEVMVLVAGFVCGLALPRAVAHGQLVPVLAVLAATGMVALLTLVPREGNPPLSSPRLSLLGGRRGGADALANIALFVPLGMALASAKLRPWQAVAAAAALSIGAETAQYWIPGRSPAVGDVVMNALGASSGWLLLRAVAGIWQKRQTPVALTLLVSAFAPAIIAGAGWLLAPVIRDGEYRVQWTPARRHMEPFGGRLTAVRIGDRSVPAGTHPGMTALFSEGLLSGAPLVLEGAAGPAAIRPSPLLRVVVRGGEPPRVRETLALITYRDDALLHIGQRAREFRLFEPHYRFPLAFASAEAGDPLVIETRRAGRGWCLRVGANASCRAFGVGDGWALLVSSVTMPRAPRAALTGIWLLLLAVPAGVVAPRRNRGALLHAAGFAVAIGVAVWLPGTLVLRSWEAALLAASHVSAVLVGRRLRRARQARTDAGHAEPARALATIP